MRVYDSLTKYFSPLSESFLLAVKGGHLAEIAYERVRRRTRGELHARCSDPSVKKEGGGGEGEEEDIRVHDDWEVVEIAVTKPTFTQREGSGFDECIEGRF